MSVVIETTVGDLTVDLFLEERPTACLNFIKLCKLKYYNYNLFHTIEQDFIAQTGDPTGAGDGGSSVWGVIEGPHKRFFEAESLPKILHTSIGLLSLVSPAKNLVGSQFFFTLGADLTSLDGQHCIIGEVVEGNETLRRLNEAIVDEKCRPYQDIRITHTVILEDPFPDMRGFRAPSRSPSPKANLLQNGRIAADEDIDDTEGKTMEEVQEMLAEREAKARATILEIVGDLPDAECAPPENVLFVCKLNPVTTDDDLEIIFSRFGKVNSCEVIRDKKSGDSLQYAFVEFDEEKACETAYFKMNNVLIDDRRIHVDFSQSVARVKWRGKGRGVEHHGRLDFNNLREGKSRKNDEKDDSMTTEERRKAREKRHREQQDTERNKNDRNTKRREENSSSRRRDYHNERDKFETQKLDNYRPHEMSYRRKRGNDDNDRRRVDSPNQRKQRNDSSSWQRKRDEARPQPRDRREETNRNVSPDFERRIQGNRNYRRSRSQEQTRNHDTRNYSQQHQHHKSSERTRYEPPSKRRVEANYELKRTQKHMDLREHDLKKGKTKRRNNVNTRSSSSSSSRSTKSSSSEEEQKKKKKHHSKSKKKHKKSSK